MLDKLSTDFDFECYALQDGDGISHIGYAVEYLDHLKDYFNKDSYETAKVICIDTKVMDDRELAKLFKILIACKPSIGDVIKYY